MISIMRTSALQKMNRHSVMINLLQNKEALTYGFQKHPETYDGY